MAPQDIALAAAPFEADGLHRRLNGFNHTRFEPTLPHPDWAQEVLEHNPLLRVEGDFVEASRHEVCERALTAPRVPSAFVVWFEELRETGPGQGDPLFPWLAEHATLADMRWFVEQEIAAEAGFEDLVAFTQVKMPQNGKLELARSYWDELGQGRPSGMQGAMLARLSSALGLRRDPNRVMWEALALGNLMSALAANRRCTYHAVGALGIVELTAPARAACVDAGLERLGFPADVRGYFAVHATLDAKQSKAWTENVLYPLVEARPMMATAIAEGALMRLAAGEHCFERYRQELWTHELPLAAGH
jgi:hypothetical protein